MLICSKPTTNGHSGPPTSACALGWKRAAVAAVMMAGLATAQPVLTTVQDILYRADGTRFNGTMYITYNSFQAGDASNVATANLALPIVNGVLKVQLAPTTTASAGAQYSVTYNNNGINQFTQAWAVPPSTLTLRVRDVLVSTGTVVGPAAVTSPVQISDVVGLENELAIRPMDGIGFAPGRAAVINQSGQIDAAAGNLSDCVRVDGSAGPCGSAGGSGIYPNYSDGEIPLGLINSSNTTFTLAHAPSPAASLALYRNGLLMSQGADYTITANVITFFVASVPRTGDSLLAGYRFGNPNNPLGSLTQPQVVCSSAGSSTGAIASTSLGTCTIPAGLLGTGDRIEVHYQYVHSGTAVGFTGTVLMAGVAVVSRAEAASESALVGHTAFGIGSGVQVWDTQSWGVSSSVAANVGSSTVDTTQALTVDFRGLMASAGADSIALQNFTVIRYPAQVNP
jgi:hypothetical protein